nr:hypothetical protein [Tanacetum cinerariifolium]
MTTIVEQIALDNALVAPENQCFIGKCNMRIKPGMKPKEPTYQVFWATVNKHNASYQFKIDNKRFSVNVKVLREILNICLKIPGKEFDEPPSKEEALSFIRELSHTGEIKYINNIDNKDSNNQDKMYYPRFMKAIIHHFYTKDKSISIRNSTFMHTARDDSLLGTMIFLSKHEDTQVYGALLPKVMTNQAMLDSVSYKTYYAIATGAEPPKSKKSQKKSDSAISSKETPSKKKPAKGKKDVPSTKKPATKPKPTKKKAPIKADRGKGLNVLLEVALSEAAQLKEATKRSKKDFHISQASGSGDGTNFEPGVLDEKQRKLTGTDEGTEEDDDDEDDFDDESNDGDNDDYDDDNDDERTERKDYDEEKENKEKEDDAEELYRDINVNLRKRDVEMTNADQGRADQHNVSQESGFEQVEEDAHVTLTVVHDTQKTEGLMKSASVSFDFTISDFATHVIEQNVIESLEAAVLAKSSSQPKSTYKVAASILEFKLTKILMNKMEERKSYLRVDYKRELYDTMVKSYNIDKDLFQSYGDVFMLKINQDEKDKDQDPLAGSDRGTKRRKSSKKAESSKDPKSKESKSLSSSKGTYRS